MNFNIHSNKRLSRDILEYKKIENLKPYSKAKAQVSIKTYELLSEEYPDQKNWQIFASLSERKEFFKNYDEGNAKLSQKYSLKELNSLTVQDESLYEGLSDTKRLEIEKRYYELLNKPKIKFEYIMRKLLHKSIDFFPLLDSLINLSLIHI